MGQKVNPNGLRVGINKNWDSQWFASKKDFGAYLKEDNVIRNYIKKTYYASAISKIVIERAASRLAVTVYTARPAVLIGKQGSEIEKIKKDIMKLSRAKQIAVNIVEIKKPDADAQLIAESIAAQLEKRVSFRRAMKQSIGRAMRSNVKGVKVSVAGRLDGAEIARTEGYHDGSIPLQTLRADIDYGFAEAHTTFGVVGVKAWIYKGEIIGAPAKKTVGGEN